ncbi:hypothetical protein [Pseudomonas sp. p1(2021b)]|uniref:hypothetical protein n=1 Tax=Pseudomonas sp. p1(2021b) TaxID=2874628 RepID=UPI003D2C8C8C
MNVKTLLGAGVLLAVILFGMSACQYFYLDNRQQVHELRTEALVKETVANSENRMRDEFKAEIVKISEGIAQQQVLLQLISDKLDNRSVHNNGSSAATISNSSNNTNK